MRLPLRKILTVAKSNYEKAWLDSKKYLKMEGHYFDLKPQGKEHPLRTMMQEAREAMVKLGFEELVLPMFVDEKEVYKEYGPEAALILDRLYYLAELPRPDIGVSQSKIAHIQKIVPGFDKIETLKSIFRRYKKGEIEADDLIEVMVMELDLEEHQATEIIDKVFPEFKELKPVPTTTTLRSHTTALWFLVLEQMVKKRPLPLQYFIVGPKFRREQKQDATHLYVSNTLSIVVAAEEISLEDGKRIGMQIAKAIGFDDVKVETKKATSKYYAPQTEFEIFVQHPITKEWVEIGDGGFYSPVSLANYNIDVPVLNIGFGCERITMIRTQETDIRRLVYPYFYEDIFFTDKEIPRFVYYREVPQSEEGKKLVSLILSEVKKHANEIGPIEIEIWKGTFNNRTVSIIAYEPDEGATLLGKAARNVLWVKDGKLLSSTEDTEIEGGIKTSLSYLEGIVNLVVRRMEELTEKEGPSQEEIRIKFVKKPGDVNITMDDMLRSFFTSSGTKSINIKGPVFTGFRIIVE